MLYYCILLHLCSISWSLQEPVESNKWKFLYSFHLVQRLDIKNDETHFAETPSKPLSVRIHSTFFTCTRDSMRIMTMYQNLQQQFCAHDLLLWIGWASKIVSLSHSHTLDVFQKWAITTYCSYKVSEKLFFKGSQRIPSSYTTVFLMTLVEVHRCYKVASVAKNSIRRGRKPFCEMYYSILHYVNSTEPRFRFRSAALNVLVKFYIYLTTFKLLRCILIF